VRRIAFLITSLVLASVAHGHDFFIFGNSGQSQDQQDQDEFQCIRAATDRTGFDPMARAQATRPPPQQQGGAGQGAVRGALLGTAVGALAGDTRRGATIGAASGGLMGGMRRADSNAQRDQWAREETANYERNRANWERAFTACMESRDYTVR
jgi:hypothetical protein